MEAWEERNWIGKIIEINNISFKVEKNIPRCVAINLKPNTDDNSLDLLKSLKKHTTTLIWEFILPLLIMDN